ncbi:hypothetical protein AC1031_007340 [Aphanomyces cochlioides]|nr:hypothetical protein AC1031_007340 [Aphanomyces cochlioides]
MLKLFCVVIGQGRPFPVKIALDETVGELKDMIKVKKNKNITCDADELELYLALTDPESWMSDEDPNSQVLSQPAGGNSVNPSWLSVTAPEFQVLSQPAEGNSVMPLFVNAERKMLDTEKLSKYFSGGRYPDYCDDNKIHVVVVVPAKTGQWSAQELSTIDPQDSFGPIDVSTALVVDRTSTHVYLLANLHLFLGEEYMNILSPGFNRETELYLKLHPGKKANAKRKKETTGDSVVIEQLFPDEEALKEVCTVKFSSDICWNCSATFDFAILKIPTPPNVQLNLVRCEMTFGVYAPMPVHLFGFPENFEDENFDHSGAIVSAKVTGMDWNQMILSTQSALGLSGCAIVYTNRGTPVGYFGGGSDGSSKNEQCQSYAYTLHGIPPYLPSDYPPRKKKNRQMKRS